MNLTELQVILPTLRRWIDGTTPENIAPELVRRFQLQAWCYYRNRAELPPPLAEEFGHIYRLQSARALKLSCAVQQVEALLERHRIHCYCPRGNFKSI